MKNPCFHPSCFILLTIEQRPEHHCTLLMLYVIAGCGSTVWPLVFGRN